MGSTTGRMLGHAFMNSIECFREYAEYCCRMPAAFDKYEDIKAASADSGALVAKLQVDSKTPYKCLLYYPAPFSAPFTSVNTAIPVPRCLWVSGGGGVLAPLDTSC